MEGKKNLRRIMLIPKDVEEEEQTKQEANFYKNSLTVFFYCNLFSSLDCVG